MILLAVAMFVTACAGSGEEPVDGRSAHTPSAPVSEYAAANLFTLGNPGPVSRQALMDQLRDLLAGADGTYGIYVFEFDSGEAFGINENLLFEGASTIKVPVLMLLFEEIEAGRISLEDRLTYEWSDYEEGTGSIQHAGVGSSWTVAQVAEKMMKESDNVAKNMLFRRLGLYAVEEYAVSMGAEGFDIVYNRVTPRDMGLLLQQIYENRVVGPELTQMMLSMMTDSFYEDRIPRYLGNLEVAHKIGTKDDSVSDIGIIFSGASPFILCVYSDSVASEAEAEEVIARIAWTVTNYQVLKKYNQAES